MSSTSGKVGTSQQPPASTDASPINFNCPGTFKKGSKLHRYLVNKAPNEVSISQRVFSLQKVQQILRSLIIKEDLFDHRNPCVVLCDEELEQALDARALHVTEIRDYVLRQMDICNEEVGQSLVVNPSIIPAKPEPSSVKVTSSSGCESSRTAAGRCAKSASPKESASESFDVNASYSVNEPFLKVLRSLPGVDKSQLVFTYKELTNHLSRYILDNKTRLFDVRNHMVVICRGDPLGEAFGLDAFHRSQVTSLLRKQLRKPNMDQTKENSPSVSRKRPQDECNDESTPDSSTGPARKKSNKGNKRKTSISLTFELTSSEEVSDQEEVITSSDELRFNTSPERKEASTDDEEEFNIENVYSVEYEIPSDSDSNEEGKDKDDDESDSSSDDSDMEKVLFMASVLIDNDTDLAEWADSSDTEDSGSDFTLATFDVESGNETWKCLNCHQPNDPFIRYCHRCWQERKGWVPERPKPKRKRKEKRTNGQNIKSSKQFVRSVSEEARCKTPLQVKDVTSVSDREEVGEEPQPVYKSTESVGSQDSGVGSAHCSQEDLVKSSESDVDESLREDVAVGAKMSLPLCTFCCVRPKNASFIHGKISHQVCCYQCAKKLYKQKQSCPVCRRKIEKITKNIMV